MRSLSLKYIYRVWLYILRSFFVLVEQPLTNAIRIYFIYLYPYIHSKLDRTSLYRLGLILPYSKSKPTLELHVHSLTHLQMEISATLHGTNSTPEKLTPGLANPPSPQVHHHITITNGTATTMATESLLGSSRQSSFRRSQSSWLISPRRILLFFATL